jgi:hypothetical protein
MLKLLCAVAPVLLSVRPVQLRTFLRL